MVNIEMRGVYMANDALVQILRNGVEDWKHWRKENSEQKIDLSEANFRDTNLAKVDRSGADLT